MSHSPVVPDADTGARSLLERLYRLSGERTLSGQHNTPREGSLYSDEAARLTGHYPAIWGQDFGFSGPGDMDGVEYRPAVVAEAIRQHRSGSVITLMWHAVRPTEDEPVTFEGSICRGPLDDADWRELLDEGSETHARWRDQIDVVASYLAQLRDAGVPVLWRPYHEMNGDWFWWGGRGGAEGYAALYRAMFARYTQVHHLTNLIWVWNTNAPRHNAAGYPLCYPGHDVVDVLAADVYGDDYRQSHHDDLLSLAEGRPIALGEVGALPTPEILAAQPRWAWFMTWSTFLTRSENTERVHPLFDDPRVVHRDEL